MAFIRVSSCSLPVPSTICTASALNCGLNFRRCSGMDASSQEEVPVQDPWYTPMHPHRRSWATGSVGNVDAS